MFAKRKGPKNKKSFGLKPGDEANTSHSNGDAASRTNAETKTAHAHAKQSKSSVLSSFDDEEDENGVGILPSKSTFKKKNVVSSAVRMAMERQAAVEADPSVAGKQSGSRAKSGGAGAGAYSAEELQKLKAGTKKALPLRQVERTSHGSEGSGLSIASIDFNGSTGIEDDSVHTGSHTGVEMTAEEVHRIKEERERRRLNAERRQRAPEYIPLETGSTGREGDENEDGEGASAARLLKEDDGDADSADEAFEEHRGGRISMVADTSTSRRQAMQQMISQNSGGMDSEIDSEDDNQTRKSHFQRVARPSKNSSKTGNQPLAQCDNIADALGMLSLAHSKAKESLEIKLDRQKRASAAAKNANVAIGQLKEFASNAERRYALFSELLEYSKDLMSCLNEKAPIIEDLEVRLLEGSASRAQRLGTFIRSTNFASVSGIEEPSESMVQWVADREAVLREADLVFEDASEEFSSLQAVWAKLQLWRRQYTKKYKEAFMGEMLPSILSPFLRLESLEWNPVDSPAVDELPFVATLFDENEDSMDDELNAGDDSLVPRLVSMVIVPRILHALQREYTPTMLTQSKSLAACVESASMFLEDEDPAAIKSMITAAATAMRASIEQVEMVNDLHESAAFQLVLLVESAGCWSNLLSPSTMQSIVLDLLISERLLGCLKSLTPSNCMDVAFKLLPLIPLSWGLRSAGQPLHPTLQSLNAHIHACLEQQQNHPHSREIRRSLDSLCGK